MSSRAAALPIRGWLLLALAVTFIVPALATVSFAGAQVRQSWQARMAAVGVLRDGAAMWDDAAWQEATGKQLAARGVSFALFEGGREVYRTAPAAPAGPYWQQGSAQVLTIPDSVPPKTAYIYFDWRGAGNRFWLVPVVGLGTLLLTLAAIGWFLGRTLVTPLAATSRAARRVADGDLTIELRRSRVREVAELTGAFRAMTSELQASLRRQARIEEERRLLIGAIAHDLRTPLFSLRGYLEGLEQGLAETPEKRARYMRVIHEKADALDRLVADLFAYTRIEYLEQALRREPLELGAVLRRAVEGLQPLAEAQGVGLMLADPSEDCPLEGDEHLLERAVANLMHNAIRYTPAGGRIEVSWEARPDRATFAVADSGPGIEPQDLPHLFEPLYRGEASRSPETGGAGLGLAVARRILRAHGGDLTAANRASGGAEFAGWLPRPAPSPPARLVAETGGHRRG